MLPRAGLPQHPAQRQPRASPGPGGPGLRRGIHRKPVLPRRKQVQRYWNAHLPQRPGEQQSSTLGVRCYSRTT